VRRQGWTQLPSVPKPRHGLSVAALRGSLYAIGGAAAPGHVQSTTDAYVLDLE
jgi:non-specific serine/threonine protein kinase